MNNNSYLVLDTNIWVYKTRLLSTVMGAAILYSLHQTGRVLVLPEVIEEEVKKQTLKRGFEAANTIRENYRLIEQLMGVRDDFRVPSESEFSSRVDTRLQEIGEIIKRTPFTLEHAKGALIRVMEETPPNTYKNQQFKDSAIWEAILDIAHEGDVDFITEDKAFFKGHNPKQDLADNLKRDCHEGLGNIRVFYGISHYLQSVKKEIPILNYPQIANKINEDIWEEISKRAIDQGFKLTEQINHEVSAYLTEKPNVLAVEFQLYYSTDGVKLPDTHENIQAVEVVKGNCKYEIIEKQVSDTQLGGIYLESLSGERIPAYGAVFIRADGIVIVRRTIPYTFREPLNE